MTITEPARERLYTKLREILGDEGATTLMEMLPPDRDLATRSDIHGLDQRMEKFEDRLWDFHEALRAQTRVYATIVVTAMLGVGSLSFAAAALI